MSAKAALAFAFVLAAVDARAPLQCGSKAGPPREETAGDALYSLAQEFKAKGDAKAAQETLRFLVAKYPSSRYAVIAHEELGGSETAPASSVAP